LAATFVKLAGKHLSPGGFQPGWHMPDRIALFGGSFNPPGLHHRHIAGRLARDFDTVLVVPCGPRDDKATTNLLPPVFRAALADMAFEGMPGVEVDLFDLEQDRFTRSQDRKSVV
jgi:nicotinic acid mononucleotide adenylyltransferase